MELTPCEKFLLSDSSDSDGSDVETMLANFHQQTLVMALAVKEHEDENWKRRRGSTVGRLCIHRNRHLENEMLMQDYFAENPTYPPHLFRRRYRMRRSLPLCENCSSLRAMRVIAYGVPADYADEYLRIGEDTTIESVHRFQKVIIRVFGPEYLRASNEDDTKKLMASNERRGWPGMLALELRRSYNEVSSDVCRRRIGAVVAVCRAAVKLASHCIETDLLSWHY
ncbi:Cell division cycle 5-like protein [Hordeum vulgare]|nr:Cell division cycle 5-like protein [Hordeum vulgare]